MTDDEYDRIAARAEAAGLGVSTYLRICALGDRAKTAGKDEG
ncbi:plasmid mobilization protein [Pseudosulfitobacter pseudonitzschiae]